MTAAGESASERVARLRRLDPTLDTWTTSQIVSDSEANLLLLVGEADRVGQPTRFAYPGNVSRLAGALGLYLAALAVIRSRPTLRGPVGLIGGATVVSQIRSIVVADIPVAKALSVVRLRGDGLVQPALGGKPRAMESTDRLVLVSPRTRWSVTDLHLGSTVVDIESLGNAAEDGTKWALDHADLLHVVTRLDPRQHASGFEVDWPLLREQALNGSTEFERSWPLVGQVELIHAGEGPRNLHACSARLARAAGGKSWPAQLKNAASVTRLLASLAVPPAMFDAHVSGAFMASLADRVELLEAANAGALPNEWRAFAETDWANLRFELLEAFSDLVERNRKSEMVGIHVEQLLRDGVTVDVWVDSRTHARALTTHLLTAGFSLSADDFESGCISVRSFGDANGEPPTSDTALLTGVPSPWHLSAALSASIAGPLHILTYESEVDRAQRYLGWAINGGRHDRARLRADTAKGALGPVQDDPEPSRCVLDFVSTAHGQMTSNVDTEFGEDLAEFAALADEEWLALLEDDAASASPADGAQLLPARAFLVSPGARVWIVPAGSVVDRLVARRIIPTPAVRLDVGMQVLTGSGSSSFFVLLRPYLDRLHRTGTQFWLIHWETAFNTAVRHAGGASTLASQLRQSGATIGVQAVAGWASPYRIGPRDWRNVELIGTISANVVVRNNAKRIAAVMRGVRVQHARLGRQLAAGVRRHASGDPAAFDSIEDALGVPIHELLGDLDMLTIEQVFGEGQSRRADIGRVVSPQVARSIFHPKETAS